MAALGILFTIFFVGRFPIASTAIYLPMGWLAVVAIKPLLMLVPSGGNLWLLAGGFANTKALLREVHAKGQNHQKGGSNYKSN